MPMHGGDAVQTVTKTYSANNIIYSEGEESRWAFEIISGTVELFGAGPEGPVTHAILGDGELFGEMGILDKSPRHNSARAKTEVTVHAIPRAEFLRRVELEPDTAFKVMSKLAKTLRNNDDPLTRGDAIKAAVQGARLPVVVTSPEESTPAIRPAGMGRPMPVNLVGERKPNLFERIVDAVVKDPTRRPGKTRKAPPPQDILILVGKVYDDYEDMQHGMIVEALSEVPGVRVESVDRDLARMVPGLADSSPTGPNDDVLVRATREGRRWLTEKNADLLVWAFVDETGRSIQLRFVAMASSPGERPGRFKPHHALTIPVDFYTEWTALIRSVVLSAVDPRSIAQGRILKSALPSLATSGRTLGLEPSMAMDSHEQASILSCYGNAAAIAAQLSGDRTWFHTAIESWRAAIEKTPSEDERALGHLHQQLGLTLQIVAERDNDLDTLKDTATAYRKALMHISRRTQAFEWGMMKYRLGGVLYKIDMAEGDDEVLREAIQSCQAARQVFDKYAHPIRWSEIMNTLAQILQVYGDNVRSVPVLQHSVRSCVSALQVRTPDTAPLQWAAIQNTLGSALFLLAKHTGEWEYMRQSSEAFRAALTVYGEHGAGRMATVTERNLVRAEKQMKDASDKQTFDPVWAQSFNITDTEDDFDWDAFLNGETSEEKTDIGQVA
ncbi:MAG: cyclic nucleotide-binding domain-containing protein [Rhodospirillaceae bacterium]